MSRERQTPSARGPENRSMFLTGLAMIFASVVLAVWTFSLGDIVTALGLGLLVVAGILIAGIGFSPEVAP